MKFKALTFSILCYVLAFQGCFAAQEEMGTVIGIDLGTTYSWYVCFGLSILLVNHDLLSFFYYSVGVMKNGRVEIIPNDQGNRITPSYMAFTEDG